MVSENYQIYITRREPPVLAGLSRGEIPNYPTIREIRDRRILSSLIEELSGENVILSWTSPPYGKVVGYGVYSRGEAAELLQRSKRECWGFPRIGRLYDKQGLEKILRKPSRDPTLQI